MKSEEMTRRLVEQLNGVIDPRTHMREDFETKDDQVERLIAGWLGEPQKRAHVLIRQYGMPTDVVAGSLTWHKNGPWVRTVLLNEEIPHEFPKPHKDMLEQWINYKVHPKFYTALGAFDGSVLIDRTRGQLGARCDNEGMNFLAINLAVDIIEGRKRVMAARKFYAETAIDKMHQEYTKGFVFKMPAGYQGDPDKYPDNPHNLALAGSGVIAAF